MVREVISPIATPDETLIKVAECMQGTEYPPPAALKKELVAVVREVIGPIATPDVIHWAPGLPKTRSGKIMRRILRKIASKCDYCPSACSEMLRREFAAPIYPFGAAFHIFQAFGTAVSFSYRNCCVQVCRLQVTSLCVTNCAASTNL